MGSKWWLVSWTSLQVCMTGLLVLATLLSGWLSR
jgi:hypothetical protein